MKLPLKKSGSGLFFRIIAAIILGAVLGLVLPEVGVRVLKTFNVFFAQLLKFMVPLLILGLVTPAIADVGRGEAVSGRTLRQARQIRCDERGETLLK